MPLAADPDSSHVATQHRGDPAAHEDAVKSPKSKQPLPPPRVRHEPPTVDEAIAAARDLTGDLDGQVEIAAGLMGLPQEEVRPLVARAASRRAPTSLNVGHRVVVVERRGARTPLRSLRG